jgi:hypothetical protein
MITEKIILRWLLVVVSAVEGCKFVWFIISK